jgi:NEDD4-binding protein 2
VQATADISENNENDFVELSIDKKLIEELDNTFGGGSLKHMLSQQDLTPAKFFIKSSIASRLYYEIKEAFISHEEEVKLQVLKNDLDLAKSLQEQEKVAKYSILYEEPSNNLADIMKTQAALKDFENDMNGWQSTVKPETIAQKLSKEKLFQAFPNLDKNDLISVYEAMDFNFEETVKAFCDSLNLSVDERKKIDNFIESKTKFEEEIDFGTDITAGDEEKENANLKSIETLREELSHHRDSRKRCGEIAREHMMKKNYETSAYYKNMANLHHQMIEEKEQYVANIIADTHMQTQDNSNTLNMHFFTMTQASNLLDMFLDSNITRLREVKKPFADLMLITGRGAHSANGVPMIKIQTISMLKDRNLKYTEVNPGLLKVKIFQNSILSSDLIK